MKCFLKEVAGKVSDIKDVKILVEEHLAYFIEKYINMDAVMERLAWRSPDTIKKIVNEVAGVRVDGKFSVIEDAYVNLLKEINLHTLDSISNILTLSRLTAENIKKSKIIQRKMYNKKKNQYSDYVEYMIKVDKKGNYVIPQDFPEKDIIGSDKDVMYHKDYTDFLKVFKNRDVNGIIDNFLNTPNAIKKQKIIEKNDSI